MTDVAVVALGKIGLPLAVAIASAGHRVRGADIDPHTVATINVGNEPFPGEAELAERLAAVIADGSLTATVDVTDAVRESEVVVVVVPLVVDDSSQPDFNALDSATSAVAEGLTPGTLVSYETTLPVRTTRDRFAARLAERSGLTLGTELAVVHSPERVFSGRIFGDLRRYPKLVGGIDKASTERGVAFYESFLQFEQRDDLTRSNGVWALASAEAAELAKLAETTYRDINIAFANELAVASASLGIDIYEVIEACNSQPFSNIHRPGIAVGGHCIPVYPHFLANSVVGSRLPALAREVNSAMPEWMVDRLAEALSGLSGRVVGVLGLAYRGGVKEHAFSGVFAIRDSLEARGARVLVHDPLYTDEEIRRLGLEPWLPGEVDVDAAMLHTDHDEYRRASAADFGSPDVTVDGRAILDSSSWPALLQLGRL